MISNREWHFLHLFVSSSSKNTALVLRERLLISIYKFLIYHPLLGPGYGPGYGPGRPGRPGYGR